MAYRDDTNELKITSAIAELEERVSSLEKRPKIIQEPMKTSKKFFIAFVLTVISAGIFNEKGYDGVSGSLILLACVFALVATGIFDKK